MENILLFPASDEDAMAVFLRNITKAINEKRGNIEVMGFLGGKNGYAATWRSDVFEMTPYCWCEKETCAHCEGFRPDIEGEFQELSEELKTEFTNRGAEPDGDVNYMTAPNFWHKSSGVKVWWYKYIGRGMVIKGEGDLSTIGQDCLQDILNNEGGHHD